MRCRQYLSHAAFAVAFLVALSASAVSSAAIDIDPAVLEALETQSDVPVIVMLEETPVQAATGAAAHRDALEEQRAAIRGRQAAVLGTLVLHEPRAHGRGVGAGAQAEEAQEHDFALRRQYTLVNGFSGRLTRSGLEKLRQSPVASIRLDTPVAAALSASVPQIEAHRVWNITSNSIALNGTGETVCIVDTGIDYTHPDLGGCTNATFLAGTCAKVISGYDFCGNSGSCGTDPDDSDPADDNGHGTHVAGIVASNNLTYRGVAPDAKLVALKVLNSAGSGFYSDVTSGVDWCVNNATKYNISVISMSLGCSGGSCTHWQTACDGSFSSLAAAINSAVAKNISVMVAAGNQGFTDGISDPACITNATPVGAVDDSAGRI